MSEEFRLPELGENIESGNVIQVLVSVGQEISKDQPVLELETDKATIEVPSSVAGKVKKILVKEGGTARVGEVVLIVDTGASPVEEPEAKPAEAADQEDQQKGTAAPERTDAAPEKKSPEIPARRAEPESAPTPAPVGKRSGRIVPASPSVRRIARELGINIADISGSGPGGRIKVEDIKRYSRELNRARTVSTATPAQPALPDFSKWGEVDRQAMSTIRLKTAEHMTTAWTNIPHVTQHDRADITELESHRKQFSAKVESTGGKLTVTAVLVKVAASALKMFPQFNASIDMARNEIVFKKYYHIGVAVDTERGLLVPVIRDADRKNITQIASELAVLADKARNKKITLDEMQGGTFTITNLGGIGGTNFTPIVNFPEVAILGVSRGAREPVFQENEFRPRLMLPLSLSYDHRLIDGADAARFLRWICRALEEPFLVALEG